MTPVADAHDVTTDDALMSPCVEFAQESVDESFIMTGSSPGDDDLQSRDSDLELELDEEEPCSDGGEAEEFRLVLEDSFVEDSLDANRRAKIANHANEVLNASKASSEAEKNDNVADKDLETEPLADGDSGQVTEEVHVASRDDASDVPVAAAADGDDDTDKDSSQQCVRAPEVTVANAAPSTESTQVFTAPPDCAAPSAESTQVFTAPPDCAAPSTESTQVFTAPPDCAAGTTEDGVDAVSGEAVTEPLLELTDDDMSDTAETESNFETKCLTENTATDDVISEIQPMEEVNHVIEPAMEASNRNDDTSESRGEEMSVMTSSRGRRRRR